MGSGWTKLMAAGIAVAAASCSILLGIASSPASVPARGDSVVVSDREALMRAIDRAQPGSTILLAPADYGAVTIRRASFERPIKLQRSEERRVGKECVSKCRSRWSPDN